MSAAGPLRFFTIGHSSHPVEHLLDLLRLHSIEVVVDTRSAPYSRFVPHFNREVLQQSLATADVRYLWMGNVIGGRPRDASCYDEHGHVLYGRVAELPSFREGIARVERGAAQYRVALLCAEEDPSRCHRRLLITRVLTGRGNTVLHIRGDGRLQDESELARSPDQHGLFPEEDLWRSEMPLR